MGDLIIRKADSADLDKVTRLFDQYRVFYKAPSNPEASKAFLKERMDKGDSVIILAEDGDGAVGFAQVYFTFSSVGMSRVWVLNDLFVDDEARGRGIGRALIEEVLEQARKANCSRVSLSTARDNPAQALYDSLGFKESSFKFYNFNLR